ncbi:MAG: hypothetical protein ACFFDD_07045 [Promethearchaeota archaeon]
MKLRLRDEMIPYPLSTIKGRLRLSGLSDSAISEVVSSQAIGEIETEEMLFNYIREALDSYDSSILSNFEILTKYENLRGEFPELPALAVIIEGASATGKSLIALELLHDLTATRFISTDTVRQVLRGITSEEKNPELFCHTYQAHAHRQAGPDDLDPVVRGFLAQCEVMSPHIESVTKRVVNEGAISVIEGVHIQPGSLQGLSSGVIEFLINPEYELHKAMFTSKHEIGKLTTVCDDKAIRGKEFECTRAIQDYMIGKATSEGVNIIDLKSYDEAHKTISSLILARVRDLLSSFEEGAVK